VGVVAEFSAQAAEVPRERVVPEVGISSTQRVGNVAIAHHRTGSRGQGV
jgi:hypothetical protein